MLNLGCETTAGFANDLREGFGKAFCVVDHVYDVHWIRESRLRCFVSGDGQANPTNGVPSKMRAKIAEEKSYQRSRMKPTCNVAWTPGPQSNKSTPILSLCFGSFSCSKALVLLGSDSETLAFA